MNVQRFIKELGNVEQIIARNGSVGIVFYDNYNVEIYSNTAIIIRVKKEELRNHQPKNNELNEIAVLYPEFESVIVFYLSELYKMGIEKMLAKIEDNYNIGSFKESTKTILTMYHAIYDKMSQNT